MVSLMQSTSIFKSIFEETVVKIDQESSYSKECKKTQRECINLKFVMGAPARGEEKNNFREISAENNMEKAFNFHNDRPSNAYIH